jgi:hypothetical protein
MIFYFDILNILYDSHIKNCSKFLFKIKNLSRMQTSGDEMELFAAVNRKFRYIFAQQENMKTFRTYDVIEVRWKALFYLVTFNLI